MPDLLDLILKIPNAMNDSDCNTLIKAFEEQQESGKAYKESSFDANSGNLKQSTFSAVSLIPKTPAFNIAHKITNQTIKEWIKYLDSQNRYNVKLLERVLSFSHDYRVLSYGEGNKIHPHTDWDEFTLASCTLSLNDDFNGGEFVFFNGEYTIKLNRGDALIWPADCFWVHEISPILSGTRYSVNSFITSIPDNLKNKAINYINTLPKESWESEYNHKKL